MAADVDLATTDITGQVTGGFIRLRGTLMLGHIKPNPLATSLSFVELSTFWSSKTSFLDDHILQPKFGRPGIFFLPISMGSGVNLGRLLGLVLVLVYPINNTYRRIGILTVFDYKRENKNRGCQFWKGNFEDVPTLI